MTAPETAVAGTPFALAVTISPSATSGTVQFRDGDTDLGAPVPVAYGKATLTDAVLATPGAHAITAVYSGGPSFAGSTSAAVTVTVPDIATSTVVTAPATATVGTAVALQATVTPATAGGTVQFMNGAVPIGAPVAVVDGVVTLSHTFDTAGAHSITAVHTPGEGHAGSTSAAATVTVTAAESGGSADFGSLDLGSIGSLFGS
ncbi:Ig-like domain-containing protein [Rhodococcus sp. NPDC058505]|uniref:Ig-like domain-containing protein n=1 Tax=unclassified Rhodococcus (in: high G+C Gram-positive bacteria) TaxID=192944 RepID=UPI003650F958